MKIGKFTPTIPSQARDALEITSRVVSIQTDFVTSALTFSNVASGAAVEVTGLTISHALQSSGNQVLLLCNLGLVASSSGFVNVGAILYAGTTALQIGDAASSRARVNAGIQYPIATNFGSAPLLSIATHSPGNTNSITYSVQILNAFSSTANLYVNRCEVDDNLIDRQRAVSSLVLVEIEP